MEIDEQYSDILTELQCYIKLLKPCGVGKSEM